jgi:peptidoglycan biosynthesis protein MviN/MurJ (putative lipid II flippase)
MHSISCQLTSPYRQFPVVGIASIVMSVALLALGVYLTQITAPTIAYAVLGGGALPALVFWVVAQCINKRYQPQAQSVETPIEGENSKI